MTPPRAHEATKKTGLPYKQVSRFYQKSVHHKNENPREIEAKALLKAARFLHDLQMRFDTITHNELEAGLKINRHIWMAFFERASQTTDAEKLSLPDNIATLAAFVFKRSLDVLTKPDKDKLSALITINREIAAGLMTQKP